MLNPLVLEWLMIVMGSLGFLFLTSIFVWILFRDHARVPVDPVRNNQEIEKTSVTGYHIVKDISQTNSDRNVNVPSDVCINMPKANQSCSTTTLASLDTLKPSSTLPESRLSYSSSTTFAASSSSSTSISSLPQAEKVKLSYISKRDLSYATNFKNEDGSDNDMETEDIKLQQQWSPFVLSTFQNSGILNLAICHRGFELPTRNLARDVVSSTNKLSSRYQSPPFLLSLAPASKNHLTWWILPCMNQQQTWYSTHLHQTTLSEIDS